MVQLILMILAVLWVAPVQATTYYVSTTGNNANDGLSESTPKRTVAHCVSLMVAGDTCRVRGGTYDETTTIRFSRSGTSSAPIRLAAYPGELPIIQYPNTTDPTYRILIQNASGYNVAMGWITIEGFELRNGYEGIKFHNLHNSVIQNNWVHDNRNQGIIGRGGHHITVTRNHINHNGPFATSPTSTFAHGLYLTSSQVTLTNNVIYDNLGYGLTLNGSGSSIYTPTAYAGPEFAGSLDWVIANNTWAYNVNRAAIVIWGTEADNLRVENNIFYENAVNFSSNPNAIDFCCSSSTGSVGILIRNNHSYASGSGGTAFIGGLPAGHSYTESGNVVNVSPPAFVNGGSNTLPGSPDFRLTASSPVNIAGAFGTPNNSTNVVGAFRTLANPTCSITANKITCAYPINTATPIQNLSTAGVTVGCTGSACPGSPAASSVTPISGTDGQFEVIVSGISGNACEATNQTWTLSYNSASGTWTANDNIGPFPGLHQKMFSFTGLAVTNTCTGSGPPTPPAGAYLEYLFTAGTGTTAANTGSFGASGNATLNNGVTWIPGGGIFMSGSNTQNLSIPYGSGVNPSTQSLTIGFLVDIQPGQESLTRTAFGSPLGTNQRFYISMLGGTWRLGIQGSSDGTAGDLTVDVGPQHICIVVNAATDTATLYKNGQASMSAGGVKSFTSYTLPGNFELGRLPTLTNGPAAVYKNFELYRSVEDCNALYLATQAPPADPAGTFSQTAVQFEDVSLPSVGGGPTILPSPNNTKKVVKGGAVAIVAQIECDDCDQTAFRIAARDLGTGSWLQIPNTPTAANLYMWGAGGQEFLNNGSLTTRILANGCSVVTGVTLLTASQIPQITLPASGCVMLRYLVRVSPTASGFTELRIEKQGGVEFTGSYVLGRIDITEPQGGGVGF